MQQKHLVPLGYPLPDVKDMVGHTLQVGDEVAVVASYRSAPIELIKIEQIIFYHPTVYDYASGKWSVNRNQVAIDLKLRKMVRSPFQVLKVARP